MVVFRRLSCQSDAQARGTRRLQNHVMLFPRISVICVLCSRVLCFYTENTPKYFLSVDSNTPVFPMPGRGAAIKKDATQSSPHAVACSMDSDPTLKQIEAYVDTHIFNIFSKELFTQHLQERADDGCAEAESMLAGTSAVTA